MVGDDAGTGASGADGLELSLGLGCPAAPARRSLTIVYGRRVLCAVDFAELQARAIISMANREITGQVEERDGSGSTAKPDPRGKGTAATSRADHHDQATPKPSPEVTTGPEPVPPVPAQAAPAVLGEQAGLSMKRSLQRFLEKRKARAAAAAAWPYGGAPRPAQPPGP